jgi:hypothetical protein
MLELPSKPVGKTGGAMTEFYEQPLPIRTYDIDFAGIVSNIVFIRWLEDSAPRVLDQAYPLIQGLAGMSLRSSWRPASPIGSR